MGNVIDWIKNNKLASILLLIVFVFIAWPKVVSPIIQNNSVRYSTLPSTGGGMEMADLQVSKSSLGRSLNFLPQNEAAPQPDITNRMVVQNSNLSMVVTNVAKVVNDMKSYVVALGGYMVNSNLSNPKDNSSANITFRIPSDKLDETLDKFRSLAVKVTSENLEGDDVTDQFVDNEARMSVLNSNMARFKEIMAKAVEISDILRVQQEVFNLQSQIDQIAGRNKYMEATAKMAKVTVYLSTDEFSLPYTPSQPWRPDVIFKTAVRSLILNLRNIATLLIWLIVYSVIWGPVVIIIYVIRKKLNQKPQL